MYQKYRHRWASWLARQKPAPACGGRGGGWWIGLGVFFGGVGGERGVGLVVRCGFGWLVGFP